MISPSSTTPGEALQQESPTGNKSSKAKKSSRPPVSNVFAALGLNAEDFLLLQADAKAYMLDERHPERKQAVGDKSKGEPEKAKLKMYRCAHNFLSDDGRGDRFFGSDNRSSTWPLHKDKIIQAVTPLLRRMVTNERQRLYATEARQGARVQKKQEGDPEPSSVNSTRDGRYEQSTTTDSSTHPIDNYDNLVQQTSSSLTSVPVHHETSQTFVPDVPVTSGLPASTYVETPSVLDNAVGSTDLQQYTFHMPDITSHQIPDMFHDGMIPPIEDAAASYATYNSGTNNRLDQLYADSNLTDPEWFDICAAIDGHFKLAHGNGQCAESCENYHLKMVLSQWDPLSPEYKSQEQIDQSMDAIRDVWGLVRQVNTSATTGTTSSSGAGTSLSGWSDLTPDVTLHVNVLYNNKRIIPPLVLSSSECLDLDSLKTKVEQATGTSASKMRVMTWLATGMIVCEEEETWVLALNDSAAIEWMDKELKVIVEVEQEQR